MVVTTSTTIEDLPNEILISILSNFQTIQLLPFTTTSRRIHELILLILHHRIFDAGKLSRHQLLLEAFHTSNRGAGYSICQPLQTTPLSPSTQQPSSLSDLSALYTSFRPLKPSTDRTAFRAGLADGSGWFVPVPTAPQPTADVPTSELEEKEDELVSQDIHLESHELFSQLCTRANLAKTSPRRGLFHSCVNVGEGILRVWRDWLADQAKCDGGGDGDVLWADSRKAVGLRVKVVEREALPVGPPYRAGEERDVSYTLFYDELLVRTTRLLLMVERSEELESGNEGKLCGLDGQYFVHGFSEMHHQTLVEGLGGWGEGMFRFAHGVYGAA
ncbi:hypothetical protein L207DRAFT_149569 [Hyaloscypha variabilis F]|uniref:F-box domain-containing protein n=1 Tax=Hyaloscypha variabilis (strain UAMH 11265 / GT02V1 / F) TaxID=1149755 RepID=A0A2J6S847_HYAVF|nr:hypothetical protein L207DRAFT_149569 [Hyaloscypha variabilis F]